MACSRMPERDGKERERIDSPKQAGSYSFARQCLLATSGANLNPPGVSFADVMPSFSDVALLSFYYRTSSARAGGGGVRCQTFFYYFFPWFSRPRAGLATV